MVYFVYLTSLLLTDNSARYRSSVRFPCIATTGIGYNNCLRTQYAVAQAIQQYIKHHGIESWFDFIIRIKLREKFPYHFTKLIANLGSWRAYIKLVKYLFEY